MILALLAAQAVAQAPEREALSIVTAEAPKAVLRHDYRLQLRAGGGTAPLKWEMAGGSLPPGIALDSASGRLAGAPADVGEFAFAVRVTDSSRPPQTTAQGFVLKVVAALTVEWKQSPQVAGSRISGAVEVTNGTEDDVDLTFITVAVNEIGKAFALGYQHFILRAGSSSPLLEFSSTVPPGRYIVHVDAVAEVPARDAIYRARLQTSEPLTVTAIP